MMEHNLWDTNYVKVFHLFKNEEANSLQGARIADKNLDNWYQLWNRAYKSNRMKNQEQREKWKVLTDLAFFNKRCREYEACCKNGVLPLEDSKVAKEKDLALWFKEQNDPAKCYNFMKIDYLKANYHKNQE